MKRLAVLACTAALLGGCAGVREYAAERAWDASDVVRAHVMAGVGVDVKVEATRMVGCGGGLYEAQAWGFVNRGLHAWHETIGDIGVVCPKPAIFANVHTESEFVGLPCVSGSYGFVASENSSYASMPSGAARPGHERDARQMLDLLTVRVTAFVFVGFDLELRLGEVADFALGVLGADPCGDDASDAAARPG